jgi:hypothetical protein
MINKVIYILIKKFILNCYFIPYFINKNFIKFQKSIKYVIFYTMKLSILKIKNL